MTRAEQIREYRLRQPLKELQRKMWKARSSRNRWVIEELDYAKAVARRLSRRFRELEAGEPKSVADQE